MRNLTKTIILLITLLGGVALLSGCSGNKKVQNYTELVIYFPTNEEMQVLKDSCNNELYNASVNLIESYKSKSNDKSLLKIYQEVPKATDPICVVARAPINKFITSISVESRSDDV